MLTVGSLFSGIGLLDYGLHVAGLRHAWFCEVDPWRRSILELRFPEALILPDVRLVGTGSVRRVDIIAGGFPCKGASTAGKRTGFDHPETVLWREMARAVRELRPRYVLVENVANILAVRDGAVWGEVVGDLAALGFSVRWDCLPAAAFGAPHLRDRVFAIAFRSDAVGSWSGGRERELARKGEPGARRRHNAEPSAQAAPNAIGDGIRQQPEPERWRSGPPFAGRAGEAAAHTARDAERGTGATTGPVRERVRARAGQSVEWGDYGSAIRRWEAVHGPSPEPLVRRVDDRSAARVERSRLSALGDGVLVHAGEMCGGWIVSRASTTTDPATPSLAARAAPPISSTIDDQLSERFGLLIIVEDGAFRLRDDEHPICHGYAHGCDCEECDARALDSAQPAPPAPRQPWESLPPREAREAA